MNKIILFVVLTFSILGIAQDNLHPKKIIVKLNDTITAIKHFNSSDSLIFFKDIQFWADGSEHVFIDGFVFEENKVKYEYHASENFLRIIRYNYDSITGLKEQLVKNTHETNVNLTQLHSIENIHQLVKTVEASIPKISILHNILEPNEYHTLKKDKKKEVYTRYKDTKVAFRITKKFNKNGDLIFWEEYNEWQTTTAKYKYNKKGQLINRTFAFDNYLSTTKNYYDDDLLVKSEYQQNNGRTSSSDFYYQDRILIKEIVHRPEGERVFTYFYEY